jgi:3-isopropylmalate dehydratase small subunit
MAMSERRCRVTVLGDDVNTDLLHPPRCFAATLEAARDGFLAGFPAEMAAGFRPGDILVAGRNFGCGSSRESYIRAFRAAGVSAVIAHSFSRIFYRNLINAGTPVAHHPTLHLTLTCGDEVAFNRDDWTLTRLLTGDLFRLTPPEPHLLKILSAGGLLAHLGLGEPVGETCDTI